MWHQWIGSFALRERTMWAVVEEEAKLKAKAEQDISNVHNAKLRLVEAAAEHGVDIMPDIADREDDDPGMEQAESESEDETKAFVPAFYKDRCVFITGGTGFMGQVFVSRLLGTCPDISRIFLLLRHKAGQNTESRLHQYKNLEVFDKVREICPGQLDKLCAVDGDLAQENLGLTAEALYRIQQVSLVFHCAASTRFQEPLREAVKLNVRSIQALLALCDTLPKLKVLVHVSTAYSNAENFSVEERIYRLPVEPEHLLNVVDSLPEHLLERITPDYIKPKFNTYLFTKAVAETLVARHLSQKYSIAIIRPSIVVSSWREPFPGWAVGASGPALHARAIVAGVLQVARGRGASLTHQIPVDIAADAIITSSWDTAIDRPSNVRVYNVCSQENPVSWFQFRRHILRAARNAPSPKTIAYPQIVVIPNRHVFLVLEFLGQTFPLYLMHFLCWLFRVKIGVSLVKLSARVRILSRAFAPFVLCEWHFEDTNLSRLRKRLSAADRRIYNIDTRTVDWGQHLDQQVRVMLKHQPTESDLRRLIRLRCVYYCYWLLLLLTCCKLLHMCVCIFTNWLAATVGPL